MLHRHCAAGDTCHVHTESVGIRTKEFGHRKSWQARSLCVSLIYEFSQCIQRYKNHCICYRQRRFFGFMDASACEYICIQVFFFLQIGDPHICHVSRICCFLQME